MNGMSSSRLAERIRAVATVSFSRSGGPGGQNVNKTNTHVVLRVPVAEVGLSEEEETLVRRRLSGRISATGELVLHSAETRSQRRNRDIAVRRAIDLIDAARKPAPKRKPTRPGTAAETRRLERKRARGRRKRERRAPDREE